VAKKKGSLRTTKETLGDIIKKYGKIASFIGGARETAEAIGQTLANYDIETLKVRIESKLISCRQRIVVFIDDIDRLEKNEIHAIFRLVKLTGDFPFLTYILSFDENMVSAAIGERFGEGNKKAGISFLDKIIQIPLKLPVAQKAALKNYCFQMVDQNLTNNKIVISENEARNFANKFVSYFLIRLFTPRSAIRYSNTLSFTLPLLKNEVNTIDLLLIEAIHVFYPQIYEFIRNQPEYFIGKYKTLTSTKWDTDKVERYNKLFDKYCTEYSLDEKECIKSILNDIFPSLKQGLEKIQTYDLMSEETLYNLKSISSTSYFNRYFSYTVIEGDVSDVAYNELIELIKAREYSKSVNETKNLIKKGTPENFIQKIRFKTKTFDSKTAIKMAKIIGVLGDEFPNVDSGFMQFSSPYSQATYFVNQLVRNQIEINDKTKTIKWLIENAQPFSYAVEIIKNIFDKKEKPKVDLKKEDELKLAKSLINRAISLSKNNPIWSQFPLESKYLLGLWANILGKNNLHSYIKSWIERDIKLTTDLIRIFTPLTSSNIHPLPYNGDLNSNQYEWMKNTIEVDYLFNKVSKIIGYKPNDKIDYLELENQQTDDNMLIQFIYWYNQDKKETNPPGAKIITEQ